MKADYKDITSRIQEPPKWYDVSGTPRYDTFSPKDTPSIYAKEAVLYLIECQECEREFLVAEDWSWWPETPLSEQIQKGLLDYGDPPRHGTPTGCGAGDTMKSIPLKTLEFWSKSEGNWIKVPELEGVDLTPDWAKEEAK